jgi:DNA-binding LacI/PurR family transcriptional regulator
MVKGISNPFFANMIKEVERQVNLRGCPLLIQHVEDGVDEINTALQLVKEKNLYGVIFMGGTYDHSEEKFRQLSIPFVLTTITTTQDVDPSVFSSVVIDDVQESYKATSYLISLVTGKYAFWPASQWCSIRPVIGGFWDILKRLRNTALSMTLHLLRIASTVQAPDSRRPNAC